MAFLLIKEHQAKRQHLALFLFLVAVAVEVQPQMLRE
jgi:hypothetical protein